jgi:hypothetical protein
LFEEWNFLISDLTEWPLSSRRLSLGSNGEQSMLPSQGVAEIRGLEKIKAVSSNFQAQLDNAAGLIVTVQSK